MESFTRSKTKLISRCKVCSHEQECCAPPCENCQSMELELVEVKK